MHSSGQGDLAIKQGKTREFLVILKLDFLDNHEETLNTVHFTKKKKQNIKTFIYDCRANITTNVENLNSMDTELQNTMGRVQEGNNRIAALELGVRDLKTKAEQLRNNASDIQSKDVEGELKKFCQF